MSSRFLTGPPPTHQEILRWVYEAIQEFRVESRPIPLQVVDDVYDRLSKNVQVISNYFLLCPIKGSKEVVITFSDQPLIIVGYAFMLRLDESLRGWVCDMTKLPETLTNWVSRISTLYPDRVEEIVKRWSEVSNDLFVESIRFTPQEQVGEISAYCCGYFPGISIGESKRALYTFNKSLSESYLLGELGFNELSTQCVAVSPEFRVEDVIKSLPPVAELLEKYAELRLEPSTQSLTKLRGLLLVDIVKHCHPGIAVLPSIMFLDYLIDADQLTLSEDSDEYDILLTYLDREIVVSFSQYKELTKYLLQLVNVPNESRDLVDKDAVPSVSGSSDSVEN